MKVKTIQKYIPVVLSILGSGGVIATGYLSAKAGINVKEIALDETKTKEQKKKEILKEIIPVGLVSGATIGCIFSSNLLSNKNSNQIKTEMAAGYVLLQNGYNEYRKQIDKETNERVLKKISEEKVKTVAIPVLEEGKYPWCDMYHEKPWYATEGDVYWAEIRTKEMLQHHGSVSLAEFYDFLRRDREIDIPHVPNEEDLIWDVDVLSLEWDMCDITFSNLYDVMEDGTKHFTLEFLQSPYPSSEIEKRVKEMEGDII